MQFREEMQPPPCTRARRMAQREVGGRQSPGGLVTEVGRELAGLSFLFLSAWHGELVMV